jgi:DNA modification methylase
MSVRILVGDCMERLDELPDESVHCCVTSPPYWGLRDYGEEGQIGLEETPEAYVERLVDVFREVRRVLRDDGTLWLNLGDSYAANRSYQVTDQKWREVGNEKASTVPPGPKPKDLVGIPWRVAFALQADGWWLRSAIVWHKPNPMPESVRDRPTSSYEHVFLLAKSERYFYDADAIAEESTGRDAGNGFDRPHMISKGEGNPEPWTADGKATRNRRNVWTITTKPYSEAHFAVYPPDLIEPCIKAGTSEKGRCPECGAPWERVVGRRDPETTGAATGGDPARADGGVRERDPSGAGGNRLARIRIDGSGWTPACDHDAEPVPCTVLDPFGGAGTTGLVADRLGRDAVLIELNPEYAEMAEHRIRGDAPMLVDVELV